MCFVQRISISCYLWKIVTVTGFWFRLAKSLSYINFFLCVSILLYTHIYILFYIYMLTHTWVYVCTYVNTHNTHIYILTLCLQTHAPEKRGIIPAEMSGLFSSQSLPHNRSSVFCLQHSVFLVASEQEAVRPGVWGTPGVPGGKRPVLVEESCWGGGVWHRAGECGRWEDRWWGILQKFLFATTWWLDCALQWWAVSHAALLRLGTRFTVKSRPPTSVFCHLYFKDKWLLAVGYLAVWTLSSLLALLSHKSGTGYFNYVYRTAWESSLSDGTVQQKNSR